MILFRLIKKLVKIFDINTAYILCAALLLNIGFGVAFFYAERHVQEGLTLIDSIWWAMVTMTTVGYGDFYAKTLLGRFLISYPCMLLGIGIIGYMVGAVANYFIEWAARKRRGELNITVTNHIILCNYPGEEKVLDLIEELRAIDAYRESPFVLVTDKITRLDDRLAKAGVHFVSGSGRNEEILHRANILHCAGVIILAEDPHVASSDDSTYTIGSLIELIGVEYQKDIKTVVEVVSASSLRTMARAKVDGTVSTDGVAGCLLAQEFHHPGVTAVVNQLITATHGSQLYLHRSRLVGKTLVRLQQAVLEHDENVQIIGIVHGGKTLLNPDKKTQIAEGDTLIILAENEHDMARIEQDLIAHA